MKPKKQTTCNKFIFKKKKKIKYYNISYYYINKLNLFMFVKEITSFFAKVLFNFYEHEWYIYLYVYVFNIFKVIIVENYVNSALLISN